MSQAFLLSTHLGPSEPVTAVSDNLEDVIQAIADVLRRNQNEPGFHGGWGGIYFEVKSIQRIS